MTNEIIIRNLVYVARKRNIKIGTLEDRIGVSRGYISRCKSPKSMPVAHLIKAAEVLNWPISGLIDEDLRAKAELAEIESQIEELYKRKHELEKEV